MVVIAGLSSDAGSAEHTGALLTPLFGWLWPAASPPQLEALHALVRKAAHLTEYGVLGLLWYRAFRAGWGWPARRASWQALALSVGWAVLDEVHQSFVPSRTASSVDVGIDAAGAALGLMFVRGGWRAVDVLIGVLLWTTALGGAGLIALHLALGVPGGILWFTTPVAGVAALVVMRLRPRLPKPSDADPAYPADRHRTG
jgi:VanZ family protein